MSLLPEGTTTMHALEAASFAPVLFALLLGALPLLLPFVLCRWLSVRIGNDDSRCRR